jgi:hypothetical protein
MAVTSINIHDLWLGFWVTDSLKPRTPSAGWIPLVRILKHYGTYI